MATKVPIAPICSRLVSDPFPGKQQLRLDEHGNVSSRVALYYGCQLAGCLDHVVFCVEGTLHVTSLVALIHVLHRGRHARYGHLRVSAWWLRPSRQPLWLGTLRRQCHPTVFESLSSLPLRFSMCAPGFHQPTHCLVHSPILHLDTLLVTVITDQVGVARVFAVNSSNEAPTIVPYIDLAAWRSAAHHRPNAPSSETSGRSRVLRNFYVQLLNTSTQTSVQHCGTRAHATRRESCCERASVNMLGMRY